MEKMTLKYANLTILGSRCRPWGRRFQAPRRLFFDLVLEPCAGAPPRPILMPFWTPVWSKMTSFWPLFDVIDCFFCQKASKTHYKTMKQISKLQKLHHQMRIRIYMSTIRQIVQKGRTSTKTKKTIIPKWLPNSKIK